MNKEKQIKEMTNDICDIEYKGMKCYDNCEQQCDCRMFAEALYNAGYRKQSEGEWIRRYSKHTDHLGTFQKYDGDFCSVCGELGYSKFCPNCGAKMKGK